MNKKISLVKNLFTFIGVICFSFLIVGHEASADSLLTEQNEINKNLIKVDTQGIDAELYVDPTEADDILITIDGDIYKIEDNKLVKVEEINDEFSGMIQPYAIDSYFITLNNGQTDSTSKSILKNTSVLFTTIGPREARSLTMWRDAGDNLYMVASVSGSGSEVGFVKITPFTFKYRFDVKNYSATRQTWQVQIEF